MILDFSDLKKMVNDFLDGLDHCLLLNKEDKEIADKLDKLGMRTMLISTDPTAERLSERLYINLKHRLATTYPGIYMDYVTVFENENSKATFTEDE